MTEIQNSKLPYRLKKEKPKYVWVIEYWNLGFCNEDCEMTIEFLSTTDY
jgi:hypothetical protein